jgi:hypothetical protein
LIVVHLWHSPHVTWLSCVEIKPANCNRQGLVDAQALLKWLRYVPLALTL